MALQLSALLFVRSSEVRHARWREFDLAGAVWNIPAEIMKMDRPHRVPLARQAVGIVRHLEKINGKGEFLFPAITTVWAAADEREYTYRPAPPPRLHQERGDCARFPHDCLDAPQ